MEAKKPAKKVFDVTSPKKVTPSPSGRPLIVTNRPIMKQDPMVSGAADKEATDFPSTAPEVTSTKQITVTPPVEEKPAEEKIVEPVEQVESVETDSTIADTVSDEPEAAETPSDEPASATEHHVKLEEASTIDDATVAESKPAKETPTDSEPDSADEPETADKKPDEAPSEAKDEGDEGAPAPDIEAQKAAEAEAKRQAEFEHSISKREYFVPINAVEQKKSIHVSVGLTFVTLILAFLLIDLMLDSGVIELINRIPHTHFFSNKEQSTVQTVQPKSTTSTTSTVDANKTLATANAKTMQAYLEAYFTKTNAYPSTLTTDVFSAAKITVDSSVFTPPTGTSYTYSPTPTGCTTAAKNCQHYTLDIGSTNSSSSVVTPFLTLKSAN